VLLLDTVRASALGEPGLCNINKMAKAGTTYTNVVAPGTWTAPSHAALFTNNRVSKIRGVSRDFFTNGTRKIDPWKTKTRFLDPGSETIARRISALGYQSALFSNNPFLTSLTNLGAGFDNIYDVWLRSNLKYNKGLVERLSFIIDGGADARELMFRASYTLTRLLPKKYMDRLYLHLRQRLNNGVSNADGTYRLDRGAADTSRELKNYLDYRYNYMPQFIFINYMEAHENYPVSRRKQIVQDKWLYLSGIRELDGPTRKELYKGYLKRIRYLDRSIGNTLDLAKERGLLDNATVVITSDHGQLFGEHGLLYHSQMPYEEVVKVPLIAANYSNGKMVSAGARVDDTVSLNALHGSLFDLASGRRDHLNGNVKRNGYVFSEHMGISEGWDEGLLKLLKSRSKSAELVYNAKRRCNAKAVAVYRKEMKLMHYFGKRGDELYDLSRDPGESDNIIARNRSVALELARQASASA
jgi:arylsulfatase A-like enzyme